MLARIETLLAIGKQLRGQEEDTARGPLPRRWIDLIHHLNEQEQRSQRRQPQAEPRERPQRMN